MMDPETLPRREEVTRIFVATIVDGSIGLPNQISIEVDRDAPTD
jgi:hypothetical protein